MAFSRVRAVLLLPALAALASLAGADSDFAVSSTATASVESGVSNVSFVKQWTLTATETHDSDDKLVTSSSSASSSAGDDDDSSDDSSDSSSESSDSSDDSVDKIDALKIEVAGRVFVSYVSGLPSGVLAYVNVSGDSEELVDKVTLLEDADDNEELLVTYSDSGASTSGYLLTEIFLAVGSVVKHVDVYSSAEVVIEDEVLVTYNVNKKVRIKARDESAVFVDAGNATMKLQVLKLEVFDSASLQLSVDTVSVTKKMKMEAHESSSVAVQASSVIADTLKLESKSSGEICISSERVTAYTYDGEATSHISLPNASTKYSATGTSDCAERSVPEREPKYVSKAESTVAETVSQEESSAAARLSLGAAEAATAVGLLLSAMI